MANFKRADNCDGKQLRAQVRDFCKNVLTGKDRVPAWLAMTHRSANQHKKRAAGERSIGGRKKMTGTTRIRTYIRNQKP